MSAFERAWHFTLTQEVGPAWVSPPTDPDIIAGAIDTAVRRRKVGFRAAPEFAGFTTKFGIQQGANPMVNVPAMTYAQATNVATNSYWNAGLESPADLAVDKPRTAIMLFDMFFLLGKGNARFVLREADVGSLSDLDACAACYSRLRLFLMDAVAENVTKQRFAAPWQQRASALLSFATTTPL